jgi:ABC-type transport system involved in multi-copper enzyme maturation permease subunit
MGNYLMIIRNNRICALGMDAAAGIVSCIIVMVVSIVLGSVYFNRKNIL